MVHDVISDMADEDQGLVEVLQEAHCCLRRLTLHRDCTNNNCLHLHLHLQLYDHFR